MEIQQKLYTIEEFEQMLADPANQDRLLELIDGEIVEKMPTEKHGEIVLTLGGRMNIHAEENNLGIVTTEARHAMPNDPNNDRLPDISFIAGDRPAVEKGSVPQMPDLAVEVKSPDDTYIGLRAKADYYIKNGSKMVLLLFYEKIIIEVYRPNADVEILTIDDTLDCSDVLPGFQISVRKIFRK